MGQQHGVVRIQIGFRERKRERGLDVEGPREESLEVTYSWEGTSGHNWTRKIGSITSPIRPQLEEPISLSFYS